MLGTAITFGIVLSFVALAVIAYLVYKSGKSDTGLY